MQKLIIISLFVFLSFGMMGGGGAYAEEQNTIHIDKIIADLMKKILMLEEKVAEQYKLIQIMNTTLLEMAQDNTEETPAEETPAEEISTEEISTEEISTEEIIPDLPLDPFAEKKKQYGYMLEYRAKYEKLYEEYYGKKSNHVWEDTPPPEENAGHDMDKWFELGEGAVRTYYDLEGKISEAKIQNQSPPTGTLALEQWDEWTDPATVNRRLAIHNEIETLLPEFNELFVEYKRVLQLTDDTKPLEFLGRAGAPRILEAYEVSPVFQENGLTESEYKDSLISIKNGIVDMPKKIAEEIKRVEEAAEQIELDEKKEMLTKFSNEGSALHRELGISVVSEYLSGKDSIPPIPHNYANEIGDAHTIEERIQNAKDILNWLKSLKAHLES